MRKSVMKIVDDWGCEVWVEPIVRELFTHAKIKSREVVITFMDFKRIYLAAEVWDETQEPEEPGGKPGAWIDKKYVIKYWVDERLINSLQLSYWFYDEERVMVEVKSPDGSIHYSSTPRDIDEGTYKIISWFGKPKCIRL